MLPAAGAVEVVGEGAAVEGSIAPSTSDGATPTARTLRMSA